MRFDEFVAEKQTALGKFVDYWTEGNAKNPNDFPLEMEAGDWDEQFHFFVEAEGLYLG